ncbi:NAD(P)H-dependent oxidoreductase [Zobellia sp. 1_MG-2023]|uniref:NAD(P)H-dependent oxidoreductase n=1 Tax=Zobellia sp. 1_MG-2023 TaxID=3062626 RepID=UPI0026E213AD|nr:NAD(P)H-dependent oxidoreductase [Zobellia sp. 1_MG-2023]MDO6820707.1 NAD(P)H-dependent oxidoreductase [Zobellia sp. 1_MG-2023]
MNYIDHLKWRYATKKFDASKKIAPDNLEKIKEAIQLSASSYGLQLYKVLIIEDPSIREQLKTASWGQDQITDASHLIVFCNYTHVEDVHVDDFLHRTAITQNIEMNNLSDYGNFMKGKIKAMTALESFHWTVRQTYLALGNLLSACAELKIDSCPMEGFEADKYNAILGLTEKGLNAAVVATIGYRSHEDHTQHRPKVRKPLEELFEAV